MNGGETLPIGECSGPVTGTMAVVNPGPRVHQQRPATWRRVRRAAKPTAASAVTLVALVAGAGCTHPWQACNEIGADDTLSVRFAPDVRADLATLDVELCQGDRCGDVTFAATLPNEPYVSIEPGVSLSESTYVIEPRVLGEDWDDDDTSRITVRGAAADGTEVVQRSESFEFDKFRPNGEGCPPEVIRHTTRIGERDRTS